METLTVLLVWLLLGIVGGAVMAFIHWIDDLDFTRWDLFRVGFFSIIFGPVMLLISIILLFYVFCCSRPKSDWWSKRLF